MYGYPASSPWNSKLLSASWTLEIPVIPVPCLSSCTREKRSYAVLPVKEPVIFRLSLFKVSPSASYTGSPFSSYTISPSSFTRVLSSPIIGSPPVFGIVVFITFSPAHYHRQGHPMGGAGTPLDLRGRGHPSGGRLRKRRSYGCGQRKGQISGHRLF